MSTIIDNEIGVIVFNSNKEVPKFVKGLPCYMNWSPLHEFVGFDEKPLKGIVMLCGSHAVAGGETYGVFWRGRCGLVKELKLIKCTWHFFGCIMHRRNRSTNIRPLS
ncbi:MAG: hypothetical protein IPP34_20105 [Bacteroidetes bacterium]|nr:hypothetical protein [Bacteroidota bacterium]